MDKEWGEWCVWLFRSGRGVLWEVKWIFEWFWDCK